MFEKSTPNLGLPQWGPKDHPDFLTDINEAFKTIDERIHKDDESSEEIAQLTSQVNKLTEDLDELTSDVDALKQAVDVDDIAQMKTDIATLTEDVGNIKTALQTNTASITEISSHLTVIDSDIATMKANIAKNAGDIQTNTGEIAKLNTALDALQTTVTGLQSRISTVETDVDTAQNDIRTLQSSSVTATAEITQLKTDVTTAGNNAQTAVNTANSAHADAENALNNVAELTTKINKIEAVLGLYKTFKVIYTITRAENSDTGASLPDDENMNTEIAVDFFYNAVNLAVAYRKWNGNSTQGLKIPGKTSYWITFNRFIVESDEEIFAAIEKRHGRWLTAVMADRGGVPIISSESLEVSVSTTHFTRQTHLYISNSGTSPLELQNNGSRKGVLFGFSTLESAVE